MRTDMKTELDYSDIKEAIWNHIHQLGYTEESTIQFKAETTVGGNVRSISCVITSNPPIPDEMKT